MRRCRLAVCAALAAVAAVAGILPFAQAARADPSDISIVSVSSPGSGSGALSVVVSSGTPLTGLTVHLSQGADDVLDVSDFDLSDASFNANQDTTYQLQTPLTSLGAVPPAENLPPGTYSVTVDATDGGGSVLGVTPQQPGSQAFPFLIQQAVQLNPATIDYASPVVTFTGQVTGMWPGTSTALPVGNALVQMSGPFGSLPAGPSGLTTAAGDFSISAPTAEVGQQYTAAVAASSQGTPFTSKSVDVTETAATVNLSASLAKTTIKYGQADAISGTATYTPATPPTPAPAVTLPLPGATVTLSAPGQPHLTTVTKANGTFTTTLPAQKASIEWTASVGGTPLLELAADPLRLNVQLPTEFKKVSLTLGAFRSLSVQACLNVTSAGSTKFEIIEPVTLQYARAAKGPWRNLAVIEPHENTTGYCAAGTPIWLGSAHVPVTNGYYRLTFDGASGVAGVSLQPAFTAAAHRWRNPTRVTSFKVTPHQVRDKGTVTVSGRLWHDTGAWHPYAGRRVQILFKVGGNFFAYTAEPKTNSRGFFTGRFVVQATALFLGQYSGDKTDFGSASGQVKVTVTGSAARFTGTMPGIRRMRPSAP